MLTGNQLAAGTTVAGFRSPAELAAVVSVSRATLSRAEAAGDGYPAMSVERMMAIVAALERASVEFVVDPGRSFPGGLSMRRRA